MAREKGKTALPKDEQALTDKITKLAANKNPSEAQKKEIKELRSELAGLRFIRLAPKRVKRAISTINAVGKLTGNGYRYTKENADKISKALADAINNVVRKFNGQKENAEEFTL